MIRSDDPAGQAQRTALDVLAGLPSPSSFSWSGPSPSFPPFVVPVRTNTPARQASWGVG